MERDIMKQKELKKLLHETINERNFSFALTNEIIQTDAIQKKAYELIIEHYDINTLSKKELADITLQTIILLFKRIEEVLKKEEVTKDLLDEDSEIHKLTKLINEDFTNEIINPVDSLIDYHINKNEPTKLIALMTAFKCLDLEDEVKKLTLTGKQYKTWLETDLQHINTEQFEVLFSMPLRKQAELRSFRHDPLPSFQIDGKGKHYYNKQEVTNWLSNYKRQQ